MQWGAPTDTPLGPPAPGYYIPVCISISTGESSAELCQLALKEKEAKIRCALEQLRDKRSVLRKQRLRREFPIVSVVGYTNCGEGPWAAALPLSTVMRRWVHGVQPHISGQGTRGRVPGVQPHILAQGKCGRVPRVQDPYLSTGHAWEVPQGAAPAS